MVPSLMLFSLVTAAGLTASAHGRAAAPRPPPAAFSSAAAWPHCAAILGDVQDTSHCGCSWAAAVADAAAAQLCIATLGRVLVPLSTQDICFNAKAYHSEGCDGGNLFDGWKWVHDGVVTGGNYGGAGPLGGGWCSAYTKPSCRHHDQGEPGPSLPDCGSLNVTSSPGPTACDAGAKAPHNQYANDKYRFNGTALPQGTFIKQLQDEADIQAALVARGPVTTSINIFENFFDYRSGVLQTESGENLGGLAVSIVGWGEDAQGVKYWRCKNTWNAFWGEQGFFRVLRGENYGGMESGAYTTPDDVAFSGPGV
jgi:cathepsin B